MTEDQAPNQATALESGFTYRTVTKYWPRIAAGIVVLAGVSEWVIGGLTADTGIEFYLMAWAATTGGLWFLFEKAEGAMSPRSRGQVVSWLLRTSFRESIASVPSQFTTLFDRVFGERHFTLSCFLRSSMASMGSVVVVSTLFFGVLVLRIFSEPRSLEAVLRFISLVAPIAMGAVALNLIPDYLSLFETRLVLGWAETRGRLVMALILDLLLTVLLAAFVYIPLTLRGLDQSVDTPLPLDVIAVIGFLSTFFTSVWLWLYAVSVLVSRVLVRMSGGVGFLLKVTDVEKQPFRSMGFTSVVLVSLLFLMGLPFVLLT